MAGIDIELAACSAGEFFATELISAKDCIPVPPWSAADVKKKKKKNHTKRKETKTSRYTGTILT
jgi:hypothetical protein